MSNTKTQLDRVSGLQERIRNKNASEEELLELKHDLIEHLNTPAGTLRNYHGEYGISLMELAIECYPEMFDAEEFECIIRRKVCEAMNPFIQAVMDDQRVPNAPDVIKYIEAYLTGKEDQNNNGVTVIDNRTMISNDGVYTEPEPKALFFN